MEISPELNKAYPREGGGTSLLYSQATIFRGLSPRRRGNQPRNHWIRGFFGPIPAKAGEPLLLLRSSVGSWAYPREGGGTSLLADRRYPLGGLSPRRRGNPICTFRAVRPGGPIPAKAGEPSVSKLSLERKRAYPREGGGTSADLQSFLESRGLSPRRRGNLRANCSLRTTTGPIPAKAGEP